MTDASIERANRLLLGKTTKLDAILKALVEDPTEVVGLPKPPKKIELSDEAHHALQILPAVFGRVQPEVVRPLTDVEQKEIGEEALTLEAILNDLKARQEAIKETIRHHLDHTAITSGRVTPDTPIDKNGHYVLGELKNPARLPIPGTNREWSSEYRSGKVTLSFDELLRLYEVGEIDRATFLAFTKEVRVLDEEKVYKAVRKQPGLLGVLKKITKRGLPGSALTIRKS